MNAILSLASCRVISRVCAQRETVAVYASSFSNEVRPGTVNALKYNNARIGQIGAPTHKNIRLIAGRTADYAESLIMLRRDESRRDGSASRLYLVPMLPR
jgi:hypothetical protein